jgi:hypothetical protein
LHTPSGRPPSAHSRASHSAAEGTIALGVGTTALPAAIVIGRNHMGITAGTFMG